MTTRDKRQQLILKPIDLSAHTDICVAFRKDSFVQSFGSPDKFEKLGAAGYVQWLRSKMESYRGSCCHVWLEHTIVGQLEVGVASDDSSVGRIFLVYVAQAWRRRGIGAYVLGQGEQFLKDRGFQRAGLRVGRINSPALRLYSAHGWIAVGDDPSDENLLIFEKSLAGATS